MKKLWIRTRVALSVLWTHIKHVDATVWLALLVGCLVGLLICLPLVPWSLPDSTASLLGAVFGAAIAVLGASSLTRIERARDNRQLRTAVRLVIQPIPEVLIEVTDHARGDEDQFDSTCSGSLEMVRRALNDLHSLRPFMLGFGAVNALMVVDAERSLTRAEVLLSAYCRDGMTGYWAADDSTGDLKLIASQIESVLSWASFR